MSDQRGTNSLLRDVNLDPVCIDLSSAAHQRAGMGRYQASLAEALLTLRAPLSAFVHDTEASQLNPPLSDLPTLSAGLTLRRWRLRAAMSYFGGPSMDRAFPQVGLFHATDHLLPMLSHARSVFTLHDTAYLHFPEYYLPRNRIFLRIMIPRFLRRAERVIVVSEHTRGDAIRFYDLDPDRIHVIPEGVDERFTRDTDAETVSTIRERYGVPDRFILHVGTIQPRKNLTTLLEAFAALHARHPDVGLVIAGANGWLFEGFFERLRRSGLEDRVTLTGQIPDEDLPGLYRSAEIFAYPSVYEGFGLPPLEAMACGVPVVCSNASSLPEVVGDAGILLDPLDVGGWVAALDGLLGDAQLRADLAARGPARARRFTWDAAAKQTLEVYRSVLDEPRV
jgi:glycosyltransferase involved in cell wall biosynthesis